MPRSEMIPSRSAKQEVDVTREGHKPSVESGDVTDGEGFGVGTRYSATLRERSNKSLNRNGGPSRPSANDGVVPAASMMDRKTGKV